MALIMLNVSCSPKNTSDGDNPSTIIETLKQGDERFVVIAEYDLEIFLPNNKVNRTISRAVLDTKTDIIELTTSESGFAPLKLQFKIENFNGSNNIYESYKVINLDNNKSLTLVLVENGFILGPHPADFNDVWIVYCDFENQKQVGEDLGHYFDEIEDLSFEIK